MLNVNVKNLKKKFSGFNEYSIITFIRVQAVLFIAVFLLIKWMNDYKNCKENIAY